VQLLKTTGKQEKTQDTAFST